MSNEKMNTSLILTLTLTLT